MFKYSRRSFLRTSSKLSMAGVVTPWLGNLLSIPSFAKTARFADYKAIVAIRLAGGNDGNNILIPTDKDTYAHYLQTRKIVAIPHSACIPIQVQNGSYGLHPALTGIARQFNDGNALLITNVGQLKKPITKDQIRSDAGAAPNDLLSHPTCSTHWESATTDSFATTGWGGRIADLIYQPSDPLPMILDTSSASIFTVGKNVQQSAALGSTASFAIPQISDAMAAITDIEVSSGNKLVSAAAKLRQTALAQQKLIYTAQATGKAIKTKFPTSPLGQSLANVASVVNGRDVIGAPRQIFVCKQDGFDTHEDQLNRHYSCLQKVDTAIAAFVTAMQEIGMLNRVLIFTYSEFGRSMLSNSNNGSDHAWGNHHFLLGGGIKGSRFIGTVPNWDIGGSDDLNGNGVWIPTTSVVQMVGGIATWFGLSHSEIDETLPDLIHFSEGSINL